MTYEETIELEKNVKIKNEADQLYALFKQNVTLNIKDYMGDGKFKIWSDSHNAKYLVLRGDYIEFLCEFLHENYRMTVSPSAIFNNIKAKNRVVEHFKSIIKVKEQN